MKNKTAIYIRVSTDKQEASELMQSEKCLAYCAMKEYEVCDIYVDSGVSGSKDIFSRKEGERLKRDIEKGDINNIVVWKLDRLSRNVIDGLNAVQYLNSKCVTFSIIDMGGSTIDTSTPMGKMQLTLMLAFAELERDTIKDRIKKSLNHRKENLKVYSKHTPYGFTRKNKDLIPNPKEMKVVGEIYKLKSKGKSFGDISMVTQLPKTTVHRIYNDSFYQKFL